MRGKNNVLRYKDPPLKTYDGPLDLLENISAGYLVDLANR
jgi:hypothetical protein